MTSHWQVRKLRDVLKLEYGKPLPKENRDANGAHPAFGANGILCRTNSFMCDKPSIIVGRKGSAGELTLTPQRFWPLDVTYYVTYDEKEYDLMFIYHVLTFLNLPKLAKGVKPGINRNDVYDLTFSFPQLSEQRRIVAILDEAFAGLETMRANAEKNMRNSTDLFSLSFLSLVNEYGDGLWMNSKIADVVAKKKNSIRTGPFGSQLLHSEFVDKGVAVLGIDNAVSNEFRWGRGRFITPEKYKSLARYRVFPGDVLITIMGTCGRCAVVPDNIPLAINSKHICCITLDTSKCIPEYLHAYFLYHPISREFLAKRVKGTVMDGLNMTIIKELPLLLPSTSQQRELISKLASIKIATEKLTSAYRNRLACINELKQSILHKAFSGELTSSDVAA